MTLDEHFVPSQGLGIEPYLREGDFEAVHHLIRYQWAMEVISNHRLIRNVLDIACGAGYGSFMIAQRFPAIEVLGVDYDPGAVAFARDHYTAPNLEFRQGDVTRLDDSLGSAVFNIILSFDTIEHVTHREIMLQNFINHLDRRGAILLSTPCGAPATNLQPDWEAHKIEYSAKSLYDFLRRYFRFIDRPDNFSLPHLEVFDQLEGSGIDYFLWMNPIILRDPIRINNPYAHVTGKKIERYQRMRKARMILRTKGIRELVIRTIRYWLRQRKA